MLVLSRHRNEQIVIDLREINFSDLAEKVITITVVEVRGDKARVGIEADSAIPVHRKEVYDEIEARRRADAIRAKFAGD